LEPVLEASSAPPSGIQLATSFPENLYLMDFLRFSIAPTICYKINPPMRRTIRWLYMVEKLALCIVLGIIASHVLQERVTPTLLLLQRARHPDIYGTILELCVPVTVLVFLTWFITFELVLNIAAEIAMFENRKTYADFWNSTTFMEFSRSWNLPIHDWLQQHVYLELLTHQFKGKHAQSLALYATFMISITLHELVLMVAFQKLVFPYLLALSMLQLPLSRVLNLPFIKGRKLGNIIFWFGLTIGITTVTVLYARALA
jgi:sterol O-acyltransferase